MGVRVRERERERGRESGSIDWSCVITVMPFRNT